MLNKRILIVILIIFVIAAVTVPALIIGIPDDNFDVIEINRLADSAGQNWQSGNFAFDTKYEYLIIGLDGSVKYGESIGAGYSENISRAILKNYPIIDIFHEGVIAGKLIIKEDLAQRFADLRTRIIISVAVFAAFLLTIIVGYLIYLEFVVFRPFRKMGDYASAIANGELDIPLQMDRGNIFGAFTESFNTMRLHIKKARNAEMRAYKEKNDFITEINHDMLAPLAVIKSAVQCLGLEKSDPHLTMIENKTEELESILNDLMIANLQDTTEFKIYLGEVSTEKIKEIIRICDYNNSITLMDLQDCILKCDAVRTGQIISNIITNSYKYAGTNIEVTGAADNGKYILKIRDFGNKADEREIDRFTERYYRGSNASDGNGAGLGLYIVATCQRLQGGDVYLENDNGLVVTLIFAIA